MSKTKNTRIAIAGIGGIGGYIGGKLAHHYSNIENVEILFIARGAMADAISNKGLCLVSNGISYTCLPDLTADNSLEIGTIDIFIVCTKNFSVAGVLSKYASGITKNTLVITTQRSTFGGPGPYRNFRNIPERVTLFARHIPRNAGWQKKPPCSGSIVYRAVTGNPGKTSAEQDLYWYW